jgi:hypothetical protein
MPLSRISSLSQSLRAFLKEMERNSYCPLNALKKTCVRKPDHSTLYDPARSHGAAQHVVNPTSKRLVVLLERCKDHFRSDLTFDRNGSPRKRTRKNSLGESHPKWRRRDPNPPGSRLTRSARGMPFTEFRRTAESWPPDLPLPLLIVR